MNDIFNWVFITDLHIKPQSNVRTGDLVEDLSSKLLWVINYCNINNAALLIGGDLFDKPTVPDYLKAHFSRLFMQVNNGVYSVTGNHCRLYNNDEYAYKTSYSLLSSLGVYTDLDSTEGVDFGSVYLTSKVPVVPRNKPQIVVFHGFLNKEDGLNTFHFSDLQTTDQCLVLLGHDHTPYEPLQYTDNIRIYRPGSFLRDSREEYQDRIPQLVHIKLINNALKVKCVPIKAARPASEVFSSKLMQSKSTREINDLYAELIKKLEDTSLKEESLYDMLLKVTDSTIVFYIKSFDND